MGATTNSEVPPHATGPICIFEGGPPNVCCFVLLTRYWEIVTAPGSFLQSGDLGWPDPHPPP